MKGITDSFPISNDEYRDLEKKFGNLAKFASWQLLRKNAKNNHTDEFDDVNQELIMALIRAGSYYKRQVYIEQCLEVAKECVEDHFILKLVEQLEDLWANRTRHGANRQKFGEMQEKLLEKILRSLVPQIKRPKKDIKLKIDSKFSTYTKAIIWNSMKSLGRKITKEKDIRAGQCSISEFDHLASNL